MPNADSTSYDLVPYESFPFTQTHPSRIATVATLLGLSPPTADRCRVLELGCAAGGNLSSMAQTLPDSLFVGVDLSARQIADGQKVLKGAGLKNIEMKHLSITRITPDFGQFDYIICHGVFSWVPREVQDCILEICARNLTSNGIAYVSYNTYPGWHMRGMIRDMMLYHSRQFADPHVRVKQARNLLDFLTRSVSGDQSPYSLLLKSEVEVLARSEDSYLFHEHLEDVNEPLYFHQFFERAAAKGLRYLAEVDLHVMVPGNYPPEVESVLQMLSPDLIHMEQYMDFLRNRMFRQTLLCGSHCTPRYSLRPEQLKTFWIASPARPTTPDSDVRTDKQVEFQSPAGISLKSTDPVAKAAMVYLAEVWPQAMSFDDLLEVACERAAFARATQERAAEAMRRLGQCLLACYTAGGGLVELHLYPPKFAATVGERPTASALARYQATQGAQVANLRHELVGLSEFGRQVVRHVDGSRNRAALVDLLLRVIDEGTLSVTDNGQPVSDPARLRGIVTKALDQELATLARNALLMA
jgi:methyltransferase-like protein/SAM-dependent methyltransferase